MNTSTYICACGCPSTSPWVCGTVDYLRSLGEWCDRCGAHHDPVACDDAHDLAYELDLLPFDGESDCDNGTCLCWME